MRNLLIALVFTLLPIVVAAESPEEKGSQSYKKPIGAILAGWI